MSPPPLSPHPVGIALESDELAQAMTAVMAAAAPHGAIELDPDRVQHDLARLVLALVEFLRRLLELQAIRRVQAGSLTAAEEERVGLTLMRAGEQIAELARRFGVSADELNLDLGPLGRLM